MASKPQTGPDEELKARYREALERKNKSSARPEDAKHGGPDHTHGEHGAEGGRREFRRKSG